MMEEATLIFDYLFFVSSYAWASMALWLWREETYIDFWKLTFFGTFDVSKMIMEYGFKYYEMYMVKGWRGILPRYIFWKDLSV